MEQNFDTSFIPKRPIFKEEAGIRRHQPIPVVTLIGFAIFFAALILTGLAFFVHKKESAAVEALAAQLASEKESFNPQAIEELKAIGARLQHAKGVVDGHVALTPLLELVQSFTDKSIYYEGFELTKEEKTGYTLRLRGKAPSFGLLYAQIKVYQTEQKIREVDIVSTQLDERSGRVDFEVALHLSPEVMKYVPPVPAESVSPVSPVLPVESASSPSQPLAPALP